MIGQNGGMIALQVESEGGFDDGALEPQDELRGIGENLTFQNVADGPELTSFVSGSGVCSLSPHEAKQIFHRIVRVVQFQRLDELAESFRPVILKHSADQRPDAGSGGLQGLECPFPQFRTDLF